MCYVGEGECRSLVMMLIKVKMPYQNVFMISYEIELTAVMNIPYQ